MLSWVYIIIPFCAALLSQLIKVIIEFIRHKKISINRFFDGMGGMPSTHSTLVSSLSTIVYLNYGISSFFAVTLIFSLIVIYDSMGVRYESGKQAQVLNKMTGSNLEEKIGHKPVETLIGVILGITFSVIVNKIIK